MEDSRRYEAAKYALSAAGFILDIGFFACLLKLGWTFRLRDFAETIGSNSWISVAVYGVSLAAALTAIGFPLDFLSSHVLEHRFGLSRQSFSAWLKDQAKGAAVAGLFGLAALEVVYYLLRAHPDSWWVLAAVIFIAFAVALTNLAPVLLLPIFFKFKPVEDAGLQRRLERLANRTGARLCGLFEWALGEKTRKANAAVVGWGQTRRIIASDTLLRNFSGEEIETIMAHELCHHVKGHIWFGMALQSALTFVSFFVVDRFVRMFTPDFRSISDIANVPVLVLTGMAVSLLALPVVNGFSRKLEIVADRYALDVTGDPSAFVSSMEKLADLNLANRTPNKLMEFIFYSHPSVERRIQLAADHFGQNV